MIINNDEKNNNYVLKNKNFLVQNDEKQYNII